ncbi:MAG: hypothetical protein WCI05_12525 [Myxococcales bacterium]
MRPTGLVLVLVTLTALPARGVEAGWDDPKPGAFQLLGSFFLGSGLRFNNPYRLATPLGSTAESVSRTATYADAGIGATFGDPRRLQHGLALRLSWALSGVGQMVSTPSYLLWTRGRVFAAYGRLGIPVVLTPDVTWGLESAVGAVWFFRGAVGVAGELVGGVFYGAGTRDVTTAAYPVLSGQLGLVVALERYP